MPSGLWGRGLEGHKHPTSYLAGIRAEVGPNTSCDSLPTSWYHNVLVFLSQQLFRGKGTFGKSEPHSFTVYLVLGSEPRASGMSGNNTIKESETQILRPSI